MFGSGTAILGFSNEDWNDIMTIIKSPNKSGLLIKCVSETMKNEAIEQKGRFLRMLLGTLGASLLEKMLGGKGVGITGEGVIRACEGTIREAQDF